MKNIPLTFNVRKIIFTIIFSLFIIVALSKESFCTESRFFNAMITTNEETIVGTTISNYLSDLQKNGYTIVSLKAREQSLSTRFNNIESKDIKTQILSGLDVIVACTELHYDNKVLYFKSDKDCNDFIDASGLKEGNYTIKLSNQSYSKITLEEDLTKEQAEVKKRNIKVSSRGGRRSVLPGTCFPLDNYVYISSRFGYRGKEFHTGTDFAVAAGTPIKAWQSGTVTFAGWQGNYGYLVVIEHSNGYSSKYAHCSKLDVTVGEQVSVGQIIGYVGSTGRSTGPHLHWEVLLNGEHKNPLNYVQ